jgi:hypothetical protein
MMQLGEFKAIFLLFLKFFLVTHLIEPGVFTNIYRSLDTVPEDLIEKFRAGTIPTEKKASELCIFSRQQLFHKC